VILVHVQDSPVEWVKELEKERIEAYNGVTQLNLVKPKFYEQAHSPDEEHTEADPGSKHGHKTNTNCSHFGCINHKNTNLYPHKAKFLIDHVLYLPVHKRVPLKDLEYLCQGVLKVAQRRHFGVAKSKESLLEEFKKLAKL
jgi:hypothetical protein